jgi:hypothetical protein
VHACAEVPEEKYQNFCAVDPNANAENKRKRPGVLSVRNQGAASASLLIWSAQESIERPSSASLEGGFPDPAEHPVSYVRIWKMVYGIHYEILLSRNILILNNILLHLHGTERAIGYVGVELLLPGGN